MAIRGHGTVREGPATIRLLIPGLDLAHRYDVRAVRGRGASSVVYRAFDHTRSRDVALKVLRQFRLADSAVARFEREMARVRESVEPRLVPVLEVSRAGDTLVLTGEWVPGDSLAERMAAGLLSVRDALELGAGILEALEALHRLGLVHRDLRASNVLLPPGGPVRLVDYGLARRWEDEADYVAPEQAVGGHVDARSDLYSAGVLLFEMLTGEVPLPGGTPMGTVLTRLHDAPPAVLELRPDVPPWLSSFVSRLLETDPEARYSSATAALADLRSHRVPRRVPRVPSTLPRLALLALSAAAALLVGRWLVTPHLVELAVGVGGVRALDADGRVLWSRPDVPQPGHAAVFRGGRGLEEVAAFLSGGHELDPEFNHVLVLIRGVTGALERSAYLPNASASFPGPDEYRARLSAVELDGGRDHLLASYRHDFAEGSYHVVYDPRLDQARVVFASASPHELGALADLDGDGRREMLLVGRNEEMGQSWAIAAVRLPWAPLRGLEAAGRPLAFSPDGPFAGGLAPALVWYALLPGEGAVVPDGLVVDAERRLVEVRRSGGGRTLIGFDGFVRSDASPLAAPVRAGLRERAYASLRDAVRLRPLGHGDEALVAATRAVADAERAGDEALLGWAERNRALGLLSAGHDGAAALALSALSSRPALARRAALDAATAYRSRGDLARAVSWYRRAGGDYRATEGLVLALLAQGHLDEARTEVDRSLARSPADGAALRVLSEVIRWQIGSLPERVDVPRSRGSEVARFLALCLRDARSEPAGALLPAVRAEERGAGATLAPLLALEARLLERLGRPADARRLADLAARLARARGSGSGLDFLL